MTVLLEMFWGYVDRMRYNKDYLKKKKKTKIAFEKGFGGQYVL